MRNRFQVWVKENDALAWGALYVSVATFVASPGFGLQTLAGGMMLVGGGLVAGALGTVLLNMPSRYPLECTRYEWILSLRGPRGQKAECVETMVLRANSDIQAFVLCMNWIEGKSEEKVEYRKWGREEKPNDIPFHTLDDQNLLEIPERGGVAVTLLPPSPIHRGDCMEIRTTTNVTGCFPKDNEYVSKNVLFPTGKMSFLLTFDGCQIKNVIGRTLHARQVTGGDPLIPRADGGKSVVEWKPKRKADPGDDYRVCWRWL